MFKEVHRKAVAGDTIKIVDAKLTDGLYVDGDILKVESISDAAAYANTDGGMATIWHSEYVVLEPTYDDLVANLSVEVARLSNRVKVLEERDEIVTGHCLKLAGYIGRLRLEIDGLKLAVHEVNA